LVGIMGILPHEVKPALKAMQLTLDIGELLKRRIVRGVIGRNEVVVIHGCIGKVETAMLTQALIDKFEVSCVFLVGMAGALDPDVRVGDIVAGTEYSECDLNTNIPVKSRIKPPQESIHKIAESTNAKFGLITSADTFIADDKLANNIYRETGALCIDMDSAAAAKVCLENDVDFMSIKTIVDRSGSDAMQEFEKKYMSIAPVAAAELVRVLNTFCVE